MTDSLFSCAAVQTPGANLVATVSASDEGRAAMDEILNRARDDVRDMLGRHRPVVEALRDALLERDELIGEQILETIRTVDEAAGVPTIVISSTDERSTAEAGGQPVHLSQEQSN